MKRLFLIFQMFVVCTAVSSAQVDFSGNDKEVMVISPEAGTGLNAIYVLHDMVGVAVSYRPVSGDSAVKWYVFGERGGGYAEELTATVQGDLSVLQNVKGNAGYIIEDGASRFYFWITDYSTCRFEFSGLSFPDEQDCGIATLEFNAVCPPITYYTITGVPKTLNREIRLSYTTLDWDEDGKYFVPAETTAILKQIERRIVIPAPLCNTTFIIEGDRFLMLWGEAVDYTSDTYQTKTIDIRTEAVQEERENPNEQQGNGTALGGSAPANISFFSYCTEAVAHKEWQFSKDPEFSAVEMRFNESELDYSFQEEGTFYIKFVAGNDDASCSVESDVYIVTIGESVLECPNAFSPDATPGINDEWKVSYKSLTSFKCSIFDRYGVLMTSFDDPSMGWDGKYKGKFVKPGVYYYIIEATGVDGKKYKKKGDINIVKSKNIGNHENLK